MTLRTSIDGLTNEDRVIKPNETLLSCLKSPHYWLVTLTPYIVVVALLFRFRLNLSSGGDDIFFAAIIIVIGSWLFGPLVSFLVNLVFPYLTSIHRVAHLFFPAMLGFSIYLIYILISDLGWSWIVFWGIPLLIFEPLTRAFGFLGVRSRLALDRLFHRYNHGNEPSS